MHGFDVCGHLPAGTRRGTHRQARWGARWEAVAHLPAPRHLYAHVTGSRHFHLGCYADRGATPHGETLSSALDHMVLRGASWLAMHSRILDIGCGLGGSSRLLQALGHRCVGVDPCGPSVRFAARLDAGRCRYVHGRMRDLPRELRGSFDAVLLVEVGQYHRDPVAMLARAAMFLRPGGRLIVADVTARLPFDFDAVPFHGCGRRRRAADALGLEVLAADDLSAAVRPTFPALLAGLRALVDHVPASTALCRQLHELITTCELLGRGFDEEALAYEYLVLEKARR